MPEKNEEVCCPRFDPTLWDEKEVTWDNKAFIRENIPQFMHIPLPGFYGKAVTRMMEKIEAADAKTEEKDFLMLALDPSPWKSELYMNVTKEVPNADNVRLSGTFMTKAFDGPFNNIPVYIKEMDEYVGGKGQKVLKYYFYYTTCPKCAKKYGHNYIVVFAQVK
jgi:hypothetical protein